MTLFDLIKKHEGLKLKPYKDSVGKLTIGIGRNLDDVGISEAEANQMCFDDIHKVEDQCMRELSFYSGLSDIRRMVIVDMVFNMGMETFKTFHNAISSLQGGDYELVALRMLESKWAQQVGDRAIELSYMMKNNDFRPEEK